MWVAQEYCETQKHLKVGRRREQRKGVIAASANLVSSELLPAQIILKSRPDALSGKFRSIFDGWSVRRLKEKQSHMRDGRKMWNQVDALTAHAKACEDSILAYDDEEMDFDDSCETIDAMESEIWYQHDCAIENEGIPDDVDNGHEPHGLPLFDDELAKCVSNAMKCPHGLKALVNYKENSPMDMDASENIMPHIDEATRSHIQAQFQQDSILERKNMKMAHTEQDPARPIPRERIIQHHKNFPTTRVYIRRRAKPAPWGDVLIRKLPTSKRPMDFSQIRHYVQQTNSIMQARARTIKQHKIRVAKRERTKHLMAAKENDAKTCLDCDSPSAPLPDIDCPTIKQSVSTDSIPHKSTVPKLKNRRVLKREIVAKRAIAFVQRNASALPEEPVTTIPVVSPEFSITRMMESRLTRHLRTKTPRVHPFYGKLKKNRADMEESEDIVQHANIPRVHPFYGKLKKNRMDMEESEDIVQRAKIPRVHPFYGKLKKNRVDMEFGESEDSRMIVHESPIEFVSTMYTEFINAPATVADLPEGDLDITAADLEKHPVNEDPEDTTATNRFCTDIDSMDVEVMTVTSSVQYVDSREESDFDMVFVDDLEMDDLDDSWVLLQTR